MPLVLSRQLVICLTFICEDFGLFEDTAVDVQIEE